MAIGIFMATVIFVHSYSQLSVVKSAMDGAEHVSNIDRHKNEQAYLDQHGELIQIFVLQGFVFFGSANQLLEKIKLVINGDRANKRFLVIDFNHVDRVDAFIKLAKFDSHSETILADSKHQNPLRRPILQFACLPSTVRLS